ncbi:MAG: DNA polymerase III subunit delta' [Clostridia bacterium]|nr:DNA polymerase III subunit delta' [Clostridia bacterium]
MFEKIIGNDSIKEILTKSIKNETISHSYLFVGIQGIGKKKLAFDFAKEILCIQKEQQKSCQSCVEFESHNHPDFMYLEPEGNSIKIEQIRFLQKKIQEKPIISNQKVYIVDDADKMTTEAQNCLLKTLEEPPDYATIILIGSQENAFLNTIKSRCMILHFQPIENEKMRQYMEENYGMNELTKNHFEMFQGSIGRAVALKDKQEEYHKIETMIENLEKKDLIEIVQLAEPLYQAKDEIFERLEYINILLLNHAKENYLYINCMQIVEKTKKRLKQNANYDMCIDDLIFNMWAELMT